MTKANLLAAIPPRFAVSILMKYWQVHAKLENGAQVLFGSKADSGEDALDLAHERLADSGQIVMELEVESLVPAAGR